MDAQRLPRAGRHGAAGTDGDDRIVAAGKESDPDVDARIATLAATQYGVVSRDQLADLGVSAHAIAYRVKKRRLHPRYRAVYRVGPIAARYEREMAAVLACGGSALLSYRSAGDVWRIILRNNSAAAVDVTTQTRRAPGPDVCVHRVAVILPDESTRYENLPITTPARTVLDLAEVLDVRDLERAFSLGERQGLVDGNAVMQLMERHAGRRGIRKLRALLGDPHSPALTRSEAEARFLALLSNGRVRLPETNVILNGYEVDCLWRAERLVAEIDGFAFHASKDAFERDRRRDAVLTAAGFRVIRITWRQLTREPHALLVAVAQALARRDLA